MDDPNQNWKHDSGIFRALGGQPKRARESSSQLNPPDLSLTRVPEEVIEFGDMRTLIYNACLDYYERSKPASVFMIAIDELDGLKKNIGELIAETADAFVLNLLIQTRNEFYGPSNIVLGHYVLGRYLMLLPGTLGAKSAEFAEVLRKSVNEKDFVFNKRPMRLTISIGVVHKPGHAGDQDYMIMQADQACSETMSIGGNKVTIAKITEGF